MFWVIVHLYYKAPSNQLCAFGWIWAESISLYTSEFFRLLLSSVTSSLNDARATGSHARSCHHTAPPCFTDDVVCFGSWAVLSLLHHFFFPSFWYRLILISAAQRMLLLKWSGFLFFFILDVFWQSLIWPCLVNPLYLLWRSLILIVDFDIDSFTSWRVFFSWLDVVNGFFHGEDHPPLLSFMVVQAFLCCRAHQCFLFFLKMYQTVDLVTPNVPAISLMDLFCFWSLTIVCFTCMQSSFDCMIWVHSNSFQMQMAHLESTPGLLLA